MPVNEGNVKSLGSMGVVFPVKPAQEVQIDYQLGDDGHGTTLWLVRENGRLYDDAPCATDEYIKQYRDEAPERAKEQARLKAIADAIKEPLRSQLIDLLRRHETAQAVDRYKAASGQDYPTAMRVVNALVPEARGTSPR
jgi:hypothetical protein